MTWLLFSTMQTFARVSQPAFAGVARRAVPGFRLRARGDRHRAWHDGQRSHPVPSAITLRLRIGPGHLGLVWIDTARCAHAQAEPVRRHRLFPLLPRCACWPTRLAAMAARQRASRGGVKLPDAPPAHQGRRRMGRPAPGSARSHRPNSSAASSRINRCLHDRTELESALPKRGTRPCDVTCRHCLPSASADR